ncbi:MAG: hypothetical protein HOP22_16005 [Nitrospiraceae bacterium]|nr:hypothetical protein [Nitrospiraceae bacterium]
MHLRIEVVYSLADQVTVSVTNLAIGLFFVHYATKHDYALYSIAFGLISLGIGIGNALIYTPMLVTAIAEDGTLRERHCKAMLIAQLIIFGSVVSIIGSTMAFLYSFVAENSEMAIFSLAIAVASFAALFQEFLRRYNFMAAKPAVVFGIDLVFAICVISILFLLWYQEYQEMFLHAVLAYAAAAFIAGGVGLARSGLIQRLQRNDIRNALRSAWQNGCWSLGGVTITWIQSQCYAYFLVILGAATALAEANAARLLLSPISPLSTGVMNVMTPRLARHKAQGNMQGLFLHANQMMKLIMGLLIAYVALVYLSKDIFIQLVLTGDYRDSGMYLLAWSLVLIAQTARTNTSVLLQVFREFRPLMIANAWSALVVLVFTYIFILYLGPVGSILALGCGELTLTTSLWYALRQVKRTLAQRAHVLG